MICDPSCKSYHHNSARTAICRKCDIHSNYRYASEMKRDLWVPINTANFHICIHICCCCFFLFDSLTLLIFRFEIWRTHTHSLCLGTESESTNSCAASLDKNSFVVKAVCVVVVERARERERESERVSECIEDIYASRHLRLG